MFLVSLAALTGIAFYLWLRVHYSYWRQRNVPHEKPVFLLGNMRGLGLSYHWKDINERLYSKFKNSTPIVGVYTFITRTALILDLDVIKRILIKDFQSFSDRGLFHNERDDPLTGNILFLDGARWRVLRHKVTPVFTTGKIRAMFPAIVEVGGQLEPACLQIIALSGGIVEAKDLCARYTTDVIGTCAFGLKCNSLTDPQAEFRKMARCIFEKPRHSAIVQAFMFTNPQLARQLRLKTFRDEVSEFFMKAVRETVEFRQKNNIKRHDFMDILIEMKEERDQLMAQGKYVEENEDLTGGLTLEQVTAQAVLFFLAGSDTSSTTMSFCLYELALNPNIQEKLRKEILEVLERHDGRLTYESIKEMTFLDMVLSETLRKYSVTPHLMRICIKDYQVPNTNIILEKGLRVILPLDSIHRNPDYFPQPEKFDPDRFLPAEIEKRHSGSFLPFGDGPRNCIGMRFGKIQAFVGLIALLKKFRFERCSDTQIPIRYAKDNMLLSAESGIKLKMEKL